MQRLGFTRPALAVLCALLQPLHGHMHKSGAATTLAMPCKSQCAVQLCNQALLHAVPQPCWPCLLSSQKLHAFISCRLRWQALFRVTQLPRRCKRCSLPHFWSATMHCASLNSGPPQGSRRWTTWQPRHQELHLRWVQSMQHTHQIISSMQPSTVVQHCPSCTALYSMHANLLAMIQHVMADAPSEGPVS